MILFLLTVVSECTWTAVVLGIKKIYRFNTMTNNQMKTCLFIWNYFDKRYYYFDKRYSSFSLPSLKLANVIRCNRHLVRVDFCYRACRVFFLMLKSWHCWTLCYLGLLWSINYRVEICIRWVLLTIPKIRNLSSTYPNIGADTHR